MKPILILDPGHGGYDQGGGTNEHWKEKDLALKISLYQYNRFKELGVPCALTRDKDITLEPKKRTEIVKNSGATYCISNHINAGGGQGAEFIHSIYSKDTMSQSMALCLVEAGQNLRRIFTRTLDNSKRDYYFMHRETGAVETVIVEYGFADNLKDTTRLLNQWEEYAEAIVKGFCQFIGHNYSTKEDVNYKDMYEELKTKLEAINELSKIK